MSKFLNFFILLFSAIALYGCPRLECEQNLLIENKSNGTIFVAEKSTGYRGGIEGMCVLKKEIEIDAGSAFSHYISRCIQGGWGLGAKEIYIINPSKFNDELKHYGCDSIEYYNEVLKVYKFETPEDFRKINYKLVYE